MRKGGDDGFFGLFFGVLGGGFEVFGRVLVVFDGCFLCSTLPMTPEMPWQALLRECKLAGELA